jgi:hypothetical protein
MALAKDTLVLLHEDQDLFQSVQQELLSSSGRILLGQRREDVALTTDPFPAVIEPALAVLHMLTASAHTILLFDDKPKQRIALLGRLRLVDLGQEELDIALRDEDVQLVIH